jgi:hypothetical protein
VNTENKSRIEELTEWESLSMLEDHEVEELVQLRRDLYEAELDSRSPGFDIERIDQFESDQRMLGKEIAAARGVKLSVDARFHNYERDIADDWAFVGFPKGTRIISITYRIPRRYEPEYITIRFPESYLEAGSDWRDAEAAIREETVAKATAERKRHEREHEEQERAQLARLQEKYS